MSNNDKLEFDGIIKEILPNTRFIILLEKNNVQIEGYIGGKLRMHYIKILKGDRVKVEMSPYDLTKGRIVYRYRKTESTQIPTEKSKVS